MGKAFAAFYIMLKKDDKLEGLKGSKSCMAEASRLWQELSKDDRKHYKAAATGHESAQPADAALESDVVDVAMAPKRAPNAYQVWYKESPEATALPTKDKMKEAAKLWKAMSAEAKQPLDEKAAGLKKDEVQKQKVLEEEDAKKRACACQVWLLLTLFFHRGKLAADHRKRKTLEPKDLRLGEMLSNEEKVVESLQNCQNADLNSARSAELVSRKKRKTDIFAARSPKTPSSKGRAPASPLVDE